MNKTDLILLLLFARGPSGKQNESIIGITRLVKLLFLIDEEGKIDDAFKFEPYKMGPYSSEVYTEIEFLQSFPSPDKPLLNIINPNENYSADPELLKYIDDSSSDDNNFNSNEANSSYSLSEDGQKIANKLWLGLSEEQRSIIEGIKKRYGGLPLRELLRYVYKNYPEMTVNSEIKEKVNGN